MGLGKTYSADYLIDSNSSSGVSGQVLISTATGIDWSDGSSIIGGPFLPLTAGVNFPLTGDLLVNTTGGYFEVDVSDNSTKHADNTKAKFGTSNDLEIYHDGSNSYIVDTGTGTFNLRGSTQVLIGGINGEVGIQYVENAGVGLRHNNVTKLVTESTGVAVVGKISLSGKITGLTAGTANTDAVNLQQLNDATTGALIFKGTWSAASTTTGVHAAGSTSTAIVLENPNLGVSVGSTVTGTGIPAGTTVTAVLNSAAFSLSASITMTNGAVATFTTVGGIPDLSQTARKVTGDYYICETAGVATPNGASTTPNEWAVGDWVAFSDLTTDAWQKIDNSSVLSGAGTGGFVAGWSGSGTSVTLQDAPITFNASNNTIVTGKLGIGSLNASFNLYNDGTSYFNGAVTVDAAFTQTGGAVSTFSGNISAQKLLLPDGADVAWAGGFGSSKPVLAANGTTMKMYPSGATSGVQFSLSPTVATFAGNVTTGPNISATGNTGNSTLTLQANTGNWVFTNVQNNRNLEISDSDGTGVALTIDTSANATFTGLVSGITPTAAANFTTKAYVDGLTPGAGVFLPLAGGTMATTSKIQFFNGTQFIQASDSVDLKLGAADDIILESNFIRCLATVEYARLSGGTNSWLANGSGSKLGIGTTSPKDKLHVVGVVQSVNYLLPSTAGTAGWKKLGTMTNFGQDGASAVIEIVGHTGYNATNNQDYSIKLFIKTSNGASTGPSGASFNSWYERTGGNISGLEFKWDNSATNDYDLYMLVPVHSLNSFYKVTKGTGIWENKGAAASDPGANSSTVLKATSIFNILDANVGIGIINPAAQLDVSGTYRLQLRTGDAIPELRSITADGTAFKELGLNGSALVFKTSSSEKMRLLANGNFGIGTTSPDHPLEVQGVISSADAASQKATFANVGNNLVLTANAGATNVTAKMLFNSSGAGGASVSTKMIIDGAGLVGIGTSSPNEKLQVGGNIHIYDEENDTDANLFITKGTTNVTTVNIESNGNSYFNGGNVGIGVTGPANKLTIASSTGGGGAPDSRTLLYLNKDGEAYISINSPAESFNGLRLSIAGSPKAFMELYDNTSQGKKLNIGTTDARDLVFATTNAEKMRITSAGDVLVGKTAVGVGTNGIELRANGLLAASRTGTSSNNVAYFNRNPDGGGNFGDGEVIQLRKNNTVVGVLGTEKWGINTGTPTQTLHVNGTAFVTGAFRDSGNSPGTAGQVLSSTVTGTDWIDASSGANPSPTDMFEINNAAITAQFQGASINSTQILTAGNVTRSAATTMTVETNGQYAVNFSFYIRTDHNVRQTMGAYLERSRIVGGETTTFIIPGSLSGTYTRVDGTNQGDQASVTNAFFCDLQADDILTLRLGRTDVNTAPVSVGIVLPAWPPTSSGSVKHHIAFRKVAASA